MMTKREKLELNKEIVVFICEDKKISKEIINKYFGPKIMTYCNILPIEKRSEVVKALEEL